MLNITKYGTQMLTIAYKPDSELFAVLAVIELNKDPVWFVLEDEINAKENRRIIKISFNLGKSSVTFLPSHFYAHGRAERTTMVEPKWLGHVTLADKPQSLNSKINPMYTIRPFSRPLKQTWEDLEFIGTTIKKFGHWLRFRFHWRFTVRKLCTHLPVVSKDLKN